MAKPLFALLSAVLIAGSCAFAQPKFEVASIKPAPAFTPEMMRSGQLHIGAKIDKARADFGGMALKDLITRAYRVKSFQVTGPEWMSNRFDILATLPEGASTDQVPEMLQALLADRFGLKLHRESKEFPVYALVQSKTGAKLTPRPADYEPDSKSMTRPMTVDAYASLLSGSVDRPIVDLTELKGEYMLSMEVVMQAQMSRLRARVEQMAKSNAGNSADAVTDTADAQIVAALKTLGLALEPRKLAMALLVVDHLEKTPTDN